MTLLKAVSILPFAVIMCVCVCVYPSEMADWELENNTRPLMCDEIGNHSQWNEEQYSVDNKFI